jgi:hypothetical protein
LAGAVLNENGNNDGEEDLSSEFQSIGDDDDTELPPMKKLRSTMPTWLANEYKVIRDQVTKEMKLTKTPTCYNKGTFFIGDENPYLKQRFTFEVNPGAFHHHPWFIWLPHCLLGMRIPCPDCLKNHCKLSNNSTVYLQSLGWAKKARRVVDVDQVLFIAGWRYQCILCRHTYCSWSPAILNILPPALAAQFTFKLSFRSGLTNQLADLLRISFQSGMGPDKFTHMIQAFHYQRYDEFHLQYLELVKERKNGIQGHFLPKSQPFGAFRDPNGYAGFIPGPPYFRGFYDKMVESDAPDLIQQIGMLSARVMAVDHSFKVSLFQFLKSNLAHRNLGTKANGPSEWSTCFQRSSFNC